MQRYQVLRQTVYNVAAKTAAILVKELTPGGHGPGPAGTVMEVDRARRVRSTLVLTEVGVSQRDISYCLEQMLETEVSPSWVNGQVAQLETQAAQVNRSWQPSVGEGLAGDEWFTSGQPNLLVVGNDSLYNYGLTQQPTRDGDTWACVLLDAPPSPPLASDGGTGLAAGVTAAGRQEQHQLDWDHLLRPLWQEDAQRERRAYAALEAVQQRQQLFDQAHTEKRLTRHLAIWERLERQAEDAIAAADQFHHLAGQVDAEFAMIDLTTGHLRDAPTSQTRLHTLGQQMKALPGRVCQAAGTSLMNWAGGLVSYLPRLAQALTPLIQTWGSTAVQALSRLWQVQAEVRRGHLSWSQRRTLEQIWQTSLDEAAHGLGEHLFPVWETLSTVLGRIWRGSMAAECVNSLLRPLVDRRKHADQGGLELFRFLHNTHRLARGKRAGRSPAELVGISLPDDPYVLLGLAPKV